MTRGTTDAPVDAGGREAAEDGTDPRVWLLATAGALAVLVANIGGMKIDAFGEYSIDLAIDGRHEGSIPLFVRPMS